MFVYRQWLEAARSMVKSVATIARITRTSVLRILEFIFTKLAQFIYLLLKLTKKT